jgi:hypothetical protein
MRREGGDAMSDRLTNELDLLFGEISEFWNGPTKRLRLHESGDPGIGEAMARHKMHADSERAFMDEQNANGGTAWDHLSDMSEEDADE